MKKLFNFYCKIGVAYSAFKLVENSAKALSTKIGDDADDWQKAWDKHPVLMGMCGLIVDTIVWPADLVSLVKWHLKK